jgi:hypothetical protein
MFLGIEGFSFEVPLGEKGRTVIDDDRLMLIRDDLVISNIPRIRFRRRIFDVEV